MLINVNAIFIPTLLLDLFFPNPHSLTPNKSHALLVDHDHDDHVSTISRSNPLIKLIGIQTSLPLPSLWEIVAQITIYFLLEDYGNYWIHRWLHSKWGYNNIHYMNHEYTAPISLAAPYTHWAEILLLGLPSFVCPALVPGHMVTLWLRISLRQLEAIDTHRGYEFSWSPTKFIPFYGGSEYHDYHHRSLKDQVPDQMINWMLSQ